MKKTAIIIVLLCALLFSVFAAASAADNKEDYYTEIDELLAKVEKALKEGNTEEAEKLLKELRIKVYLCAKFLAANGEYDARIMQVISLVDKAIDEKEYTDFIDEARDVTGAVLLGLPYEPRELTEHS